VDPLYSVSAEERYGVGDLMDDVVKVLPKATEEASDQEATKVAVVGRPNVGKSSLINRFLGYRRVIVDEAPGTTRDAIDTILEKNGKRYVLIDTAGIRRKSRISLRLEQYSIVEALRTIDRCDVAILVMDSREEVTDQDARIGGFIHEKGKGCVLVMNKWDLVEKEPHTMAEVEQRVKESLKYLQYAPIVFISAITGQRISKVLETVDRVAEQTKKRIATSELNRHFGRWVTDVSPPLYRNRAVKMNYITQVSTAPPTFVISTNYPESIHFSYERYLLNKMRGQFGFEGVPIRFLFRKKAKQR
jgi:GTP-binding protein